MTKQITSWQPDDLASQSLVDSLLDGMHFEDLAVRAAVEDYCRELISESTFTMADLNNATCCFLAGFKAGQKVKISSY